MSDKSKILLVDKHQAIQANLEKLPVNIVPASNLREAARYAARETYTCCLIFLDNEDPIDEETPWGYATPLIFIGKADPDLLQRAYQYGAFDFISVPFEPALLDNKLKFFSRIERTQVKLQADNLRLMELNGRIKKFVGNLAHDLRGPLGKLINTAEILLAGVDQESLKTFYNIMVRTSRRGFDLVNDILDLTALESGQMKIELERCDLAGLADQVITEMNWQAEAKEIHLNNRIHHAFEVKADPSRVFQVLTNLIGNAIKFTPRSGTVTLSAENLSEGIRLEVRDTGIGMATETVAHLFEMHDRISTPGTEGEKGTGFGLVLAQEIINRHGSEISVDSKTGEGSSFSFFLPAWNRAQAKVL